MKSLLLAACALAAWPLGVAAATSASFNVRDYGAIGDGHAKDTAALQRAVDAAVAAGGGTVEVPAGRYLTGSIHLGDHVTLDLAAGSVLLYSADPKDSPLVESRWEDTTAWTHGPLIYANGKHDIAVTGRGTLNGQGENWWWRAGRNDPKQPERSQQARARMAAWRALEAKIEAGYQAKEADFAEAAEAIRPTLVEFVHCQNVDVDGVTLTDSPMWHLHPLYCENVVVHGVTFNSWGPNGDGIDVDSVRNMRISDCFFRTGDDCIVIKSGRDNDGRRIHAPTEFITITNCVMYEGHGAIVIGSETSGDIRDITASNIVAKGTDRGIRIKSMRGRGGVVENVTCDNFVIDGATHEAIEITLLYGASKPEPLSERTPIFRNFAMSHLTIVNGKQVAAIHGLPEKSIDGLRFNDITATADAGFICDHAADVQLRGVEVTAKQGPAFSFKECKDVRVNGQLPAQN